jgi:hypothetical protein
MKDGDVLLTIRTIPHRYAILAAWENIGIARSLEPATRLGLGFAACDAAASGLLMVYKVRLQDRSAGQTQL